MSTIDPKGLYIQVLDDNPFYATFLEHQLRQYVNKHFPDFAEKITVTSHTTREEYLDAIPDTGSVSLIDFYLGEGLTGLVLLPDIKRKSSDCKVIIMTTENNLEALANVLDTNVSGFVFKDENSISLCHAILEKEIERKKQLL